MDFIRFKKAQDCVKKRGWLVIFAGLLLIISAASCGKKAPPRPPVEFELPVVDSLEKELKGPELNLTWPVPDWEGPGDIELDGFNVYRAKAEQESTCETCPMRFTRVKMVIIDRLTDYPGSYLEYREKLEEGFHYRYKVRAVSTDGTEGADSNVVKISY